MQRSLLLPALGGLSVTTGEEGPAGGSPLEIYTLGHSTHTIVVFIAMLQTHAIQQLVDVRSIPGSARNPQFNIETLRRSLAEVQLSYYHLKDLGGLRHPRPDSPNTGWRNASFRGYADYMLTPAFHIALDQLIALSSTGKTVIMCAEAVPWRCHRSLIADALTIRCVTVQDIISNTQCRRHTLSAMAQVRDGEIYYESAEF